MGWNPGSTVNPINLGSNEIAMATGAKTGINRNKGEQLYHMLAGDTTLGGGTECAGNYVY